MEFASLVGRAPTRNPRQADADARQADRQPWEAAGEPRSPDGAHEWCQDGAMDGKSPARRSRHPREAVVNPSTRDLKLRSRSDLVKKRFLYSPFLLGFEKTRGKHREAALEARSPALILAICGAPKKCRGAVSKRGSRNQIMLNPAQPEPRFLN